MRNRRTVLGIAAAIALTLLYGVAVIQGAPVHGKQAARSKTTQQAKATGKAKATKPASARKVSPLLNRTMTSITGEDVNLGRYQGKVLMIVNTASQCGNTPQYADLEQIYRKYRQQGFEVLAFPANNFGGQEPGSDGEIRQFCSSKYDVTFPLFSKISVKGPDKAPLYQRLTDPKKNPKYAGEIEWNFAKFLVNRRGEVVARFPARQKPTEPDVIAAIERELAKKA